MITLLTIITIWFIISVVRLQIVAKKYNKDFSPFGGTILDWVGFLFGGVVTFITIIYLILEYLP